MSTISQTRKCLSSPHGLKTKVISSALIIMLMGGSTLAYGGCCRIKVKIGPVKIDSGHPLQPFKSDEINVLGVKVKPGLPNPIPTTPSVQLPKGIPGSEVFNKFDNVLHTGEVMAQKQLNVVGKGIEHLGNEIGMLWSRLKKKAIDIAHKWIDWAMAIVLKYVPLAAAAFFSLILLASGLVIYVPKMIVALFRQKPLKQRIA